MSLCVAMATAQFMETAKDYETLASDNSGITVDNDDEVEQQFVENAIPLFFRRNSQLARAQNKYIAEWARNNGKWAVKAGRRANSAVTRRPRSWFSKIGSKAGNQVVDTRD